MTAAPAWVWERHDRSWRARRRVGEEVTRVQDRRDTLRVCSLYAPRPASAPPFPAWLAIPASAAVLERKAAHLSEMTAAWSTEAR